MKKLFIILLFAAHGAISAQSSGIVGINTANPTANLHIDGTLRLEHPSQGDNKILMTNENGRAIWEDRNSIRNYVSGDLSTTPITTVTNSYIYSGASITLPKDITL